MYNVAMPDLERVNIAPQARKLQEKGYVEGDPETSFDPVLGLRPELRALTAVLVDEYVGYVYERRNTQGALMLREYIQAPFAQVKEYMHRTINDAAYMLIIKYESGRGKPQMQSAFDRFQTLRRNFDPTEDALDYFSGGNGTATNTMANILSLIPDLMEGERTPERMLQAARASYPMIVNLAAMHQNSFVEANTRLSYGYKVESFRVFNRDLFELASVNGVERLGFSPAGHEVMDQIKHEEEQFAQKHKDGQRTGCPALVNFGEGSAVRRLWDWHLEIAEQVYNKFYASEASSEQAA